MSGCFIDLGPEKVLGTAEPSGGADGGTATVTTSDTMVTTTSSTGSVVGGGDGAGGESTGGAGGAGGAPPGNCTGDKVVWARQLGSEGAEYVTSTAADGDGGVFITGLFYGTLDLGGDALVSSGFNDIFFARFDGSGEHMWSVAFGNPNDQVGMSLTAAPFGDVILLGSFTGTIDFGDGAPVTAVDSEALIARYDADGALLWKKVYRGVGTQAVRSIAIDPTTGAVYLAGIFQNELLELGETPFINTGVTNSFIARLDATGEHVWSHQMVGPAPNYARDLAIGADGNLVVAGWADGDVDLGEGVLPSFGDGVGDAWAGLYDAETGDPIWTQLWADPGPESILRATIDASGAPLVAGYFEGHLALDSISADFLQGLFLARLDSPGIATQGAIIGYGVDVTGVERRDNGNVLVSGSFGNTLGTDIMPIPTTGGSDGMIVELDEELNFVSTIVVGSVEHDDFAAMTIADDGMHAFAVANFRSTASLTDCGREFTSMGDKDILLVKLAP